MKPAIEVHRIRLTDEEKGKLSTGGALMPGVRFNLWRWLFGKRVGLMRKS